MSLRHISIMISNARNALGRENKTNDASDVPHFRVKKTRKRQTASDSNILQRPKPETTHRSNSKCTWKFNFETLNASNCHHKQRSNLEVFSSYIQLNNRKSLQSILENMNIILRKEHSDIGDGNWTLLRTLEIRRNELNQSNSTALI